MVCVRGKRLTLREWQPHEGAAMHRWLGNPEVTRFLSWGSRSEADSERHLAECIQAQSEDPRSRYFLALELRETGRVIGDAGFEWTRAVATAHEGGLGYFLEPAHWGRGLGTEAASLVLELAFRECGATLMRASCDARNEASEGVMQACRMQRDPESESPGRRAYRITRESWLAR